jgi:hypothetical protein
MGAVQKGWRRNTRPKISSGPTANAAASVATRGRSAARSSFALWATGCETGCRSGHRVASWFGASANFPFRWKAPTNGTAPGDVGGHQGTFVTEGALAAWLEIAFLRAASVSGFR